MKYLAIGFFLLISLPAFEQNPEPKIEVYVAPGLFMETLSRDTLIPKDRRNVSRLGDVVSYAMQVALPLKNKRFTLKGGIGFSQRHYSINKYSLDDVLAGLFLFDSQIIKDSFYISYVKFTNNYLQVPLSASYTVTRPGHNFQLALGLNCRLDFLTNQKVHIDFDTSVIHPTTAEMFIAHDAYSKNVNKSLVTVEPYAEAYFYVYKNLGLMFQARPFSFYSSKLDNRLTTSTGEIFSSTFGVFYTFK